MGVKAQKGKSRVTQVVSYLGYPGLSKRGISGWGQLNLLFNCFASSCVLQLSICVFDKDVFEMSALVIESLISSAYIIIKKLTIRHLKYNVFWF